VHFVCRNAIVNEYKAVGVGEEVLFVLKGEKYSLCVRGKAVWSYGYVLSPASYCDLADGGEILLIKKLFHH
jgi:hypothetical protein